MFKEIFSTATFKQSQITIIGTIVNGILGALFYILVARFLGPASFGLLTVSIATLTLLSDILDFGTNTGLVRFVSLNISSNKEKAIRFLKLSLIVKIVVWSLVLSLGLFLSPFIAERVFNKKELTDPLKLVMFGVGGALLFSFATSALQSFQKYFIWSFINILTNLLRLVCILVLFFNNQINLFSGLTVYLLFPFFGFSLTLLFIPTKSIILVKDEFKVAKEFFGYNFWVAVFVILAAISARLDTFLIGRLLSAKEIGLYGAASQLVQVVPQIVGAIGIVIAPKFASFVNIKQMLVYFKKLQVMVLILSAVGLIAIPISIYFIPFAFGILYSGAIAPFIILLFAMLIFLISLPIHSSIIYYFGKPQIFVWVNLGHLLLISILGYLLIPTLGVVGAAVTVFIGMVFNLIIPLVWFLFNVTKYNKL